MKSILPATLAAFCLIAAGCGPGPFTNPTATPESTASAVPTLAPTQTATSTEAPSATATLIASATQTLAPTAVTCPKGTVLRPSVNKCYYATRTPKPEIPFCEQFKKATDCTLNGCSWNKKVGLCS